MLIEIHMLKNYGPTNLNRDDTGAPKTCVFGGVQRGRISSQCLKRCWRKSSIFEEEIGAENIGTRTRKLPQIISSKLVEDGISKELAEAMEKKLSGIGTKKGEENKKDPSRTAQAIIYSPEDIEAVLDETKRQLQNCKNTKDVEKISVKDMQSVLQKSANRSVTLDIALFGRMVTSDAFADVEASVQVAHAISTNKVLMEADYYTAVDDLIDGVSDEEDNSGSAMIGDIDYNSSCYYIYASIDTDKLRENLEYSENRDEIIRKTLPAIIKTMTFSNPSGKQNSFAGHALPSAILVEIKEKHISTSYANAFEKPVTVTREGGYIYNSVRKLKDEVQHIQDLYGIPVLKRLWFTSENLPIDEKYGINCHTFAEVINKIAEV